MFSPVGNQPSSVYWRRRLLVLGSVVVIVLLIVLTVNVASGSDSAPVAESGSADTTGPAAPSATRPSSSPASSSPSSSASRSSSSPSTSRPVVPAACAAKALTVQAVPGKTSYEVGAQPVLSLQVTNTGAAPCVQDLADKQIVLKVYNGESRVWGSHDCEIQPGASDRTLPVNQAVRVSVTWSGRTSQEGCKGARQRVGAGAYTLYATLAGKSGKAARFTIS